MRISDWSSDVCSSDLPSLASISMLQPATKPASMMMRVATQMRARSTFTNRTRSVTFSISFGADSSIVAMSVSPSCRSEEHTSELQSLMRISYAVFCLKKKTKNNVELKIQQENNYNHT